MKVDVSKNPPKTYSQDEAFAASLKYFKNDDLAARVWLNKYALKDSKGNLYELTPDDMHRHIAKELARGEQKDANPLPEEDIFNLIKVYKYMMPQGNPMALNAIPKQIAPHTM